ncbi:hypothetical protein [Hymenobacter lucidus]|uniref:Nucleoside phosphorylase domain-containing protein n=1 Tax=Hymenobacter lucidus TaxID=2880930 RepID=A0ABS8AUW8_9BACT|nr:hypothetical protein [Hymenobacter lucidus]MCB2408842.1 hypothetical protein [Hymenobacter lucidus]
MNIEDPYLHINTADFEKIKGKLQLVLITVTKIETTCLHEKLSPITGSESILVYQKDIMTYYIGVFGIYIVCHVESRMGSIGVGASVLTTRLAIEHISPEAIIMIGIAFGVDDKKQRIGDVLVSEQIISYEVKKVGRLKTEYRGSKHMSSVLLINRFANIKDWKFSIGSRRLSNVIFGDILSGEVLVDNIKYRNNIIRQFPTAIGGEMEGAGLVSSAYSFNKSWILVKGICDFADGDKAKDKVKRQKLAARAAVDLCHSVFSLDSFSDLDIHAIAPIVSLPKVIDIKKVSDALFNQYSQDIEMYYIEREQDDFICNLISSEANIWVYGGSGYGKTSLVYRNLISKGIHVIDLSLCDADILSSFEYINSKLLEQVNVSDKFKPQNIMQAIDVVSSTLNRYYQGKYIVFEEMPVDENDVDFVKYIFSLMIKHVNAFPRSTVRFACTSIGNPKLVAVGVNAKIHERIRFHELCKWDEKDMLRLLNLIQQSLSFQLLSENAAELLRESNGNPRFLKRFIYHFLVYNKANSALFNISLNEFKSNF